MPERRFTAHRHSATGLWYVFDHLASAAVGGPRDSESEAWQWAQRFERAFRADVARMRRGEVANA